MHCRAVCMIGYFVVYIFSMFCFCSDNLFTFVDGHRSSIDQQQLAAKCSFGCMIIYLGDNTRINIATT